MKEVFQPTDGRWEDYARYGGLRSVLDPQDTAGGKNAHIDRVHRLALRRCVPLPVQGLVLDYGCGTGRIAREIVGEQRQIIGLDITAEMLHHALAQQGPGPVLYCLVDGQRIPLPNASVELIVTIYVLQYVVGQPDLYRQLLAEFVRVLRPGGHLAFIEQVSFSGQKSGSVHEVIRREDYLQGTSELGLQLIRGMCIRRGRPGRAEKLLLRYRLPGFAAHLIEQNALKRAQSLSMDELVRQPYVDYLYYLQAGGR